MPKPNKNPLIGAGLSMAGMEGFEPPNASTKNWCLTTWRHPITEIAFPDANYIWLLPDLQPVVQKASFYNSVQQGVQKTPRVFLCSWHAVPVPDQFR